MKNTDYETIITGKAGGVPLNIAEAQKEMPEGSEIVAITTEYSAVRTHNEESGCTTTALFTREPSGCYLRLDEEFIAAFGFRTHDEFCSVYPTLRGVEWLSVDDISATLEISERWLQAMAANHDKKQTLIS